MFGPVYLLILLVWTVSTVAGDQISVAQSFEPVAARVVGPFEPVAARVGDSVVLPCHCSPSVDLRPLTVEWSRMELRPHPDDRLKRVPFVHVYTDLRDDDPDMKIPEFFNRTELDLERLSDGVASLTIRRVALSDNGTYKCFIPNLHRGDRRNRWALVSLIVHDLDADETSINDIKPKRNDSGHATESPPLTVGGKVAKVVVITIFVVAGFTSAVLLWSPKPEPPCYDCPSPPPTTLSSGADPVAVVTVEDVDLFLPSEHQQQQVNSTTDTGLLLIE